MHNKILNITNGDCFNKYFISKHGGTAIPFCEAMMDGEASANIFSQQFITLRAKSLNITKNEYRNGMHVYDTFNNTD